MGFTIVPSQLDVCWVVGKWTEYIFGPKLSGTSIGPKMKCIDSWINFLYKEDQFVFICECHIMTVRSFIRHHCNWNNDQTRSSQYWQLSQYCWRSFHYWQLSVEVAGCSKQGEILMSKKCVLYFMALLVLVVLRNVNT